MDEAEKLILCKLQNDETIFIEPWFVLQHLQKLRVIDKETVDRLSEATTCRPKEALKILFEEIATKCSLGDLKEALKCAGFCKVAEVIDHLLYQAKGKSLVSKVDRQHIRRKRIEDERYHELFTLVQNAAFKDPKLTLQQLSKRFKTKLKTEVDPHKRVHVADSLATIMTVEIDAHTVFGKPNFQLFEKLFKIAPQTSNPNLTEVIYYGRLGLANALDGKFEESEKMLVQARCHVYNIAACMDFVYVFYCVIYARLFEFEQNPSDDLLASIFDAFYMGMGYIAEADDGSRPLWRRMFLSRIVMALLGMAVSCKKIDHWQVRSEHVRTAKRLLAEMDQTNGGMELRRKMLYLVLRARVFEVENDGSLALHFISQAEEIAKEGEFAELQNISEYKRNLHEMDSLQVEQKACVDEMEMYNGKTSCVLGVQLEKM